MINKLKRTFGNEKYFVCFDSYGGTNFRKEIIGEYKATRCYNEEAFKAIESSKEIFEENGIRNITLDRTEADDTIFALCKVLSSRNEDNTIVSADKDMIQIVQRGYALGIYNPIKKDYMDIPEYDIVEFKSLVGDSSDNIKGVPKVGPKSALKIMNGEKELTQEEQKIYEKCKLVVDMSLNPSCNKNISKIEEILNILHSKI